MLQVHVVYMCWNTYCITGVNIAMVFDGGWFWRRVNIAMGNQLASAVHI